MGAKAKVVVNWLGRWGFVTLVGLGAVGAAWVASHVDWYWRSTTVLSARSG
jgi:hypothetical protein